MQYPIPQCAGCKHFKIEEWVCDAFLGGIPEEILIGEHDHKTKYKGDGGITFEPLEDE